VAISAIAHQLFRDGLCDSLDEEQSREVTVLVFDGTSTGATNGTTDRGSL
jgi:hypothetical protein